MNNRKATNKYYLIYITGYSRVNYGYCRSNIKTLWTVCSIYFVIYIGIANGEYLIYKICGENTTNPCGIGVKLLNIVPVLTFFCLDGEQGRFSCRDILDSHRPNLDKQEYKEPSLHKDEERELRFHSNHRGGRRYPRILKSSPFTSEAVFLSCLSILSTSLL